MLPGELVWVLDMLGYEWPTADEDKMFRSAEVWRTFASDVRAVQAKTGASASRVLAHNSGEAVDGFRTAYDAFDHGSDGYLPDAAQAAEVIAAVMDAAAGLVIACKAAVIAQLIALACEIVAAQAAAPFTFGLSEAGALGATQVARLVVRRILDELKKALIEAIVEAVKEPAISAVESMASDLIAQSLDVSFGAQQGLDLGRTAKAGGSAAWDAVKQTPQTLLEGVRDGLGEKAGEHARHSLTGEGGGEGHGDEGSGGETPADGDGHASSGGDDNASGGGAGDASGTSRGEEGGPDDRSSTAPGQDGPGQGSDARDRSSDPVGTDGGGSTDGTPQADGSQSDGDGERAAPPPGPRSPLAPHTAPVSTLSDFDDPPGPGGDALPSQHAPGVGTPTAPRTVSAPPPGTEHTGAPPSSGGSDGISMQVDALARSAPRVTRTDHSPGPSDGPSTAPGDRRADGSGPDVNGPVSTGASKVAGTPRDDAAPGRRPGGTTGSLTGHRPGGVPDNRSAARPESEPHGGGRTPAPTSLTGSRPGTGQGDAAREPSDGGAGGTSLRTGPGGGRPSGVHSGEPGRTDRVPSTEGSSRPSTPPGGAPASRPARSSDSDTAGAGGSSPAGRGATGARPRNAETGETSPGPGSAPPTRGARTGPPSSRPATPGPGGTAATGRAGGTGPASQDSTAPEPRSTMAGPVASGMPRGTRPLRGGGTVPPPTSRNPAPTTRTGAPDTVPGHGGRPDPRRPGATEASVPAAHPAPAAPSDASAGTPPPAHNSLPAIRAGLDHRPGGLAHPDPQDQQQLLDAVPRNQDGSPQRFPDPFQSWAQLQNDGGPQVPGRSNNCADCSRSFLESWYGNPSVSAPRTPDLRPDGSPDLWSPESDANANIIRWAGASHLYAGPPDQAYTRIAQDLHQAGHGSAAIIQVNWTNGGGHAYNAVNYHGHIVFVDTQSGTVSTQPINTHGAGDMFYIPLGPDRKPLHPDPPAPGGSAAQSDGTQQGPPQHSAPGTAGDTPPPPSGGRAGEDAPAHTSGGDDAGLPHDTAPGRHDDPRGRQDTPAGAHEASTGRQGGSALGPHDATSGEQATGGAGTGPGTPPGDHRASEGTSPAHTGHGGPADGSRPAGNDPDGGRNDVTVGENRSRSGETGPTPHNPADRTTTDPHTPARGTATDSSLARPGSRDSGSPGAEHRPPHAEGRPDRTAPASDRPAAQTHGPGRPDDGPHSRTDTRPGTDAASRDGRDREVGTATQATSAGAHPSGGPGAAAPPRSHPGTADSPDTAGERSTHPSPASPAGAPHEAAPPSSAPETPDTEHEGLPPDEAQAGLRESNPVYRVQHERVDAQLREWAEDGSLARALRISTGDDQHVDAVPGRPTRLTARQLADVLDGFDDLDQGERMVVVAALGRMSNTFHTQHGITEHPVATEGESRGGGLHEAAAKTQKYGKFLGTIGDASPNAAKHVLDLSLRNYAVVEVEGPHGVEYVVDSSYPHPEGKHSERALSDWLDQVNTSVGADDSYAVRSVYTEREPCGNKKGALYSRNCSDFIRKRMAGVPIHYSTTYRADSEYRKEEGELRRALQAARRKELKDLGEDPKLTSEQLSEIRDEVIAQIGVSKEVAMNEQFADRVDVIRELWTTVAPQL